MKFTEILAQIRSIFTSSTGVEMAFGKPMQVNDLSIIPVAKISFGFGGGGGSSPVRKKKARKAETTAQESTPAPEETEAAPNQVDEGGGGGGGMNTSPVGIYTIKDDKVRFYPVISVKEIMAIVGVISILLIRIARLRRKGKR